MNKYSFIKDILENDKIIDNQRDRILKLAAKELGSADTLESRISKIEHLVYSKQTTDSRQNKNSNQNSPKTRDSASKELKYRDPIHVYKFLVEYNQNPILRYTCHDLDSDGIATIVNCCKTNRYSFQEHLVKVLSSYESLEKRHFAPPAFYALFRGYLTGKNFYGIDIKDGWSSDSIKMNWSHPDLIEWAKRNPNIPPNLSPGLAEKYKNIGFEMKRIKSIISGKTIQNFTELVSHFKNLFHIRSDNSLRDIIHGINQNKEWFEQVEFEIDDNYFPANIELFTDVDKLTQGYIKIMNLIIENHNKLIVIKPRVRLTLSESEDNIIFSIHHQNSTYNKSLQSTVARPKGDKYSPLIKNQINGFCNFHLRADFGQSKYAELNLWNGDDVKAKMLDQFEGVEHVLEFPKIRK